MGKGVTKNALISLLHLSHEMMAENKDKASVSSVYSAVRVLVIPHSIKTFWNVTEHVFLYVSGLHIPVVFRE